MVRPSLVILGGLGGALLGSVISRALMARALTPAELGYLFFALAAASGLGGAASLGIGSAVGRRIAALRGAAGRRGPRGGTGSGAVAAEGAGSGALGRRGAAEPEEAASREAGRSPAGGGIAAGVATAEGVAARRAARTAAALGLGCGALAGLALAAAAPAVARAVTETAAAAAAQATALRALAPVALVLPVGLAALGISRGFGRAAGRSLIRDGGGGALRAVAVALALALGFGLPGVALAFALAVVVAEGGFLVWCAAQGWLRSGGEEGAPAGEMAGTPSGRPSGARAGAARQGPPGAMSQGSPGASAPDPPGAVAASGGPTADPADAALGSPRSSRWDRPLVAGIRPFATLELLNQVHQWMDLLVLGALAPAAAVGFFGVARSVSRALQMVLRAPAHAYLPSATEAVQQRDRALLGRIYERTRRVALALLWFPLGLCLLVPEVPVVLLAGEEYAPSAGLLRWLAVAVLVEGLAAFMDHTLVARGRESRVAALQATVLAVGLVLLVVLVPARGAEGAALALVGMELLRGTALAAMVVRETGLRRWRDHLPPALGGAAVALAAVAFGLPWLPPGTGVLRTVLAAAVAGGGALALAAGLRRREAGRDLRVPGRPGDRAG